MDRGRYFKDEGGDVLQDGWFPTGDVATIDADGYMQITDRSKDVIKSGGEWIGTIDLENIAMAHPAVLQAACIGVPHPKWDERPLLLVVQAPGMTVTREELLAFFEGKIAKFWMPDDVVFIDACRWARPARSRRTGSGSNTASTLHRLSLGLPTRTNNRRRMSADYHVQDHVAVITLNNPPVNGLGLATRSAAVEGLERAAADDAVKAIVITGAGKAFSGGADIREFNSPRALTEPTLHTLIRSVENSPKPVVAAVHSVAMGGGWNWRSAPTTAWRCPAPRSRCRK
jgi:hypothetical protein